MWLCITRGNFSGVTCNWVLNAGEDAHTSMFISLWSLVWQGISLSWFTGNAAWMQTTTKYHSSCVFNIWWAQYYSLLLGFPFFNRKVACWIYNKTHFFQWHHKPQCFSNCSYSQSITIVVKPSFSLSMNETIHTYRASGLLLNLSDNNNTW